MTAITLCTHEEGAEVISALRRAGWLPPKECAGLYLVRDGENLWTGIDSTEGKVCIRTFRYRESAVEWLHSKTEYGNGQIYQADEMRWLREHRGEPYIGEDEEGRDKCCGNCAHCAVDFPSDPQDMEAYFCVLACPRIDDAPMVDGDGTCPCWEPMREEDA